MTRHGTSSAGAPRSSPVGFPARSLLACATHAGNRARRPVPPQPWTPSSPTSPPRRAHPHPRNAAPRPPPRAGGQSRSAPPNARRASRFLPRQTRSARRSARSAEPFGRRSAGPAAHSAGAPCAAPSPAAARTQANPLSAISSMGECARNGLAAIRPPISEGTRPIATKCSAPSPARSQQPSARSSAKPASSRIRSARSRSFLEADDVGFKYRAEIPIEAIPDGKTSLSDSVKFGQTPVGKAMRFEHRGAYDDIDATYEAITAYLDEKGTDAQDVFVEEYLNEVKARGRSRTCKCRHLRAAENELVLAATPSFSISTAR